jgi:hypothetical protein
MLTPYKIAKYTLLAAAFLILFSLMSCGRLEETGTGMQAPAGSQDTGLYLFDYKEISINTTSSVGTRIKNCNIYLDLYGGLMVLGELENISNTVKTDIEITIDFMADGQTIIHSAAVPVKAEYLGKGAKCPFVYHYSDSGKYIELSSVKIGVNYRDHNYSFKGNPIAQVEEYRYQDEYLIIKGSIINIGEEKIKDLVLLCTFYDNRDRVVFIKECFLPRDRMMPQEEQDYILKILLDDYLKDFAGFQFQVFFSDEIRVNV